MRETLVVRDAFLHSAARRQLGLHYFSDVMAGYAGAVLWLSACISALEVVRRRGQLHGAGV